MTDAHVHLNIIPAAVQPLHPNTSTFLSTATPTEMSHITNTLQHAEANHKPQRTATPAAATMSTPYRSKSTIHQNRQSVNSDHLPCALHHSATLCNTRQHSTTAVRAFKPPKYRELMPQNVTPELAAALLAAYLCTLANLQTAHHTPRYLRSTIHRDLFTHIPYVYMYIF